MNTRGHRQFQGLLASDHGDVLHALSSHAVAWGGFVLARCQFAGSPCSSSLKVAAFVACALPTLARLADPLAG